VIAAMMQTEQPTFAGLCRAEMENRHETYQGMATLCGVSWRTWERWLKGKTMPYPTEAKRFATKCNLSEDEVFAAIDSQRQQCEEV